MRVSFDSNAWEEIFRSESESCRTIRKALERGNLQGFICDIALRIEAIRKRERANYFSQPQMEVTFPGGIIEIDSKPHIHLISMGPNDRVHPGLPEVQAARLKLALSAGVRLIRGLAWLGLPSPPELRKPELFLQETESERANRETLQIAVNEAIWSRGVGKPLFDEAGGWNAIELGQLCDNKFAKSCAEWADGELVAAHVSYRNDLLCTEDRGHAAGVSIFNDVNRSWLKSQYCLSFATINDLARLVSGK